MIRFTLPSLNITKDVTIPMADVKTKRFESYFPDAFVMNKVRFKDQAEFLRMKINAELGVQQSMKILIPQGFSRLGERWIYTLGDCIMNNDENADYVAFNPAGTHLSDFNINNLQTSAEWCRLFLHQGPAHAALFLCALTPYIRPITEALQFPERTVNAFVVGPSGCGKTSFAKLLTNSWNGENAGINLGTDANVLYKDVANYIDQPILIDDLNLSSSSKEMEKKLHKLSELIQLSSSGGKTEVKHHTVDMDRLSLIITGEYTPSAATKINRCVLIKMSGELPTEELTRLQQNQKNFLSFVAVFVSWLIYNSDNLTAMIKQNEENNAFMFRGAHANASEYLGFARIMASHKLLMVVRLLLLEFFRSFRVYSEEKKYTKLAKILGEGINSAISDTLEAVRKEPEKSDILMAICKIFVSDPDNIVTDDIRKYAQNENKIFLHYLNRYYFKSGLLIDYLNKKYKCSITAKALSQELTQADLLYSIGGEKSFKLPKGILGDYKGKEKCKGRHCALRSLALVELVESEYPDFLQRVHSPISSLRPDVYQ